MKKQWFGLLTILCLTVSCGDDKKDAESDSSEKAVSSICDCVDQSIKQLKENGKLDPELEEKCKKLTAGDGKAKWARRQCDGFDELMKLRREISNTNHHDEADIVLKVDEDCDKLLEQYKALVAEYNATEAYPETTEEMAKTTESHRKIMKFESQLQKTDCWQDEDFKKKMHEAIR